MSEVNTQRYHHRVWFYNFITNLPFRTSLLESWQVQRFWDLTLQEYLAIKREVGLRIFGDIGVCLYSVIRRETWGRNAPPFGDFCVSVCRDTERNLNIGWKRITVWRGWCMFVCRDTERNLEIGFKISVDFGKRRTTLIFWMPLICMETYPNPNPTNTHIMHMHPHAHVRIHIRVHIYIYILTPHNTHIIFESTQRTSDIHHSQPINLTF